MKVASATDYHPFGWEMPGRKYNSAEYRYGFNGKEKDQDGEFGSITNYDYGFRIYNPAVGRFLSVDPLTGSFPYYTPYQFAGNKPIAAIDLDGLEDFISVSVNVKSFYNPKLDLDMTLIGSSAKTINPRVKRPNIPSTYTKFGYPRNSVGYWNTMLERNPEMFSIANQAKIRNGASPTVDADWVKHNSSHAPYMDDVLVHHHHKYQGKVATAIPNTVHNEYSQVLHPFNRGNKYTKYLKGKFGFKSKHSIGGVKKLSKGLMIVGTLMGVQQLMAGDPVGSLDPFGITIAGEQALQAMDDEMFEFAITQGYSEVTEYMENCLSCPSFGMYYLSGEEAILFLSGQLNLNEIEHFTSDFFSSQEDASEFYDNEKSIEYAIPTEDGIPVGVIDVEKKDSNGSN